MAIVPRRVIQRLIRESASFTSLNQRERQVARIDRANEDSLSAEWEVLVLNGLSRIFEIAHEPLLGTRRPDVVATINGLVEAQFVADIATAFNSGYNARNPIDRLHDAIRAYMVRLNLSNHGFDLRVAGEMQGELAEQQMVLKLPVAAKMSVFVERQIGPFLRECAANPSETRACAIRNADIDIELTFKPNSRTSGRSHPSFTTKYSKTRNSVFRILRSKAKQLRDSGFQGPRGVILCAADADLASSQSGSHGVQAIAAEAFRQNSSLSFVVTLWADDPVFNRGRYHSDIFTNPTATWPLDIRAREALRLLPNLLPEPRNSGTNALHELRFWRWKRGRYFYGGFSMSERSVKISGRVLMEYLAGRLGQAEFLARHGGDHGFVTLFEQKLRQGQLLVGAEIEAVPDRDDDWIIFRFGNPDPAVAPLRAE